MEPWKLDDALTLIRALQPDTRQFGYHLCLGGGVMNKGKSLKDLDLFFLPLDNGTESKPDELLAWLTEMWGESQDLYREYLNDNRPRVEPKYKKKVKFVRGVDRIDVFIVG